MPYNGKGTEDEEENVINVYSIFGGESALNYYVGGYFGLYMAP